MFVGNDAAKKERAERAFEQALVGHLIHQARVKAGMTQHQLAKLIGTDQGVISRLESAEYSGHSLSMLRRIAAALGKRVEIRFIDAA
jgi:transcriptional regulator with XRE-family HTH domain